MRLEGAWGLLLCADPGLHPHLCFFLLLGGDSSDYPAQSSPVSWRRWDPSKGAVGGGECAHRVTLLTGVQGAQSAAWGTGMRSEGSMAFILPALWLW